MTEWTLRHRCECSGGAVRYDVMGDGPAIVLVHGTPFSSYIWRKIAPGLARHWTVYFYDLLGYGQSEMRDGQDVSLGVQGLVLAELLDHWGLVEPGVVGHDFGGATVLRTHLLGRRKFRGVVLIDAVALAPWGSPFVQHVKKYEEAFRDVPGYIHASIVATYVRGAIHRPMSDEALAPLVAPWLGSDGQAAFYRQIAQMDQRYTDEVAHRYGEIRCPIFILWGEEDRWIPVTIGERLHRAISHSEFHVVPNAGHLVQEDAPEAVTSSLVEFFARHAPAL